MGLSFLSEEVKSALAHLNYNFVSEIRLRRDRPVVVEYKGKYGYLTRFGLNDSPENAVLTGDLAEVLNRATDGCIYGYTEQLKNLINGGNGGNGGNGDVNNSETNPVV